LKKKKPILTVVVYCHPHHIEKQQSSRQGREHQHTYAPAGNQKGNQSRGAWRPTNTTGTHQAREPIPWKHWHDAEQGGKEMVGHDVHLPLGWMDGRTWYQLATILGWSYYMVSSHVLRMKHAQGGWNVVYLGREYGRYPMGMWLCIITGGHSM
jgi:hypothetical protein